MSTLYTGLLVLLCAAFLLGCGRSLPPRPWSVVLGVVLLVLGAMLTTLGVAVAGTIGVHLGSQHFPNRDHLTNVNPGLCYKADNGMTVGAFRNSLARPSVYAGYTFEHGPFGLTVGAISGYRIKNGYGFNNAHFAPLFAPSVRLPRLGEITPRLTFVPPFKNVPGVVHLSFEMSF